MLFLFIDNDSEDTDFYKEAIAQINALDKKPRHHKAVECISLTDCNGIFDCVRTLSAKPDFIFLDINMPVIGGKECLRMLKNHPETSAIPVVMLSTTCPAEDAYDFKRMGAMECIQKPNDFKRLVQIFSKFIFQESK